MRLFISYAHVDRHQVEKLVNLLRVAGHEPWFDHRLLPGDDWKQELLKAVTSCDAFVYAISPASLESDWCQWEFGKAIELRKPIVPVLLQKIAELPPPLSDIQNVYFPKRANTEAVAALMGGLLKVAPMIPEDKAPSTPREPRGTPAQVESKPTNGTTNGSAEPPGCNFLRRIPWKDLPIPVWVALIGLISGVLGAFLGCMGSVVSALITVAVPMLIATSPATPTLTPTTAPPTFTDEPSETVASTPTDAAATSTYTPTPSPSHTQTTEVAMVHVPITAPEITLALMVENQSFILYVTAKEPVFVGGMQFRIVDSQNRKQTVIIQEIFPQQLGLKDYVVQPGECYVYRELNVTPGVPSDCSEIFHEPVIRAEIFWYNFQRNERYPIQILRNGQEVRLCDTENPFCEIPYPTEVPLTPVVTEATPSVVVATTTIPTVTDSPPTATLTLTSLPTATPRPIMCGSLPIDCQPITNGEFNDFAGAVLMDDWSPISSLASSDVVLAVTYSQASAFCEYYDAHVATQKEWETANVAGGMYDAASTWQEWTSTTQVDNGITFYFILTKGTPETRLSADENPANIRPDVKLTFRCARDT